MNLSASLSASSISLSRVAGYQSAHINSYMVSGLLASFVQGS